MRELFAGTADCYRRFRPAYLTEVFDWIVAQHGLNGAGRLLDCGCGTGGVFVGLA
jgi:cyclopropane fatty-acyl-phospholipid synthase-like methyltransferase